MILVMDIGNTNIKNGLFEGEELLHSWRMSADRNRTADEMGMIYESFFSHLKRSMKDIEGIIVSSVIPSMNYTIEHLCSLYFPVKPIFVNSDLNTGMNIKYDNPRDLGADRICNAVAAKELYGGPCVTVDFGTATSFGVVDEYGDFVGGIICPGVKISAEALVERTAKLPKVELVKPSEIIGSNTVNCIQSGLIYGYVGQVDYILQKLLDELGAAKMIATGGMAKLIASESRYLLEINSTLTLHGLRIIYELNA